MVLVTKEDFSRLIAEMNLQTDIDPDFEIEQHLENRTGVSAELLFDYAKSTCERAPYVALDMLRNGQAENIEIAAQAVLIGAMMGIFELGWECRHQFGAQ